ncbi:hypothetical protein RIF29_38773 [Crotalaria pallida]|uniref:Uncharacterized protein n=1 Tax=Crotalaria pallida TaxID=3830 RepID=A0AAN9E004_CROPI
MAQRHALSAPHRVKRSDFSNSISAFVDADWGVSGKFLTLQDRMDPPKFDPSHPAELLNHLDKQKEVLQETCKSIHRKLEELQVEEEMLMRKMYKVMYGKDVGTGAEHSNTVVNDGAEHSNTGVNDEATKRKGS